MRGFPCSCRDDKGRPGHQRGDHQPANRAVSRDSPCPKSCTPKRSTSSTGPCFRAGHGAITRSSTRARTRPRATTCRRPARRGRRPPAGHDVGGRGSPRRLP